MTISITNGYATLDDLAARLPEGEQFSTADNQRMADAIEGASRVIDRITDTRFYVPGSDETRYYSATFPDLLYVPDDFTSLTTLKTDDDGDGVYETTWTVGTDYRLEPRNASQKGIPYRQIRVDRRTGRYSFPVGVTDGVELVGLFGYSATASSAIKTACLMIAQRIWLRNLSPFGIGGSTAAGGIQLIDAQIKKDPEIMLYINMGFERRGF